MYGRKNRRRVQVSQYNRRRSDTVEISNAGAVTRTVHAKPPVVQAPKPPKRWWQRG